MQTSMRLSEKNRDQLAKIARDELGGVSLDEALRVVLFQHSVQESIKRALADPEGLAEYQREAREWAELDVQVRDVNGDEPW